MAESKSKKQSFADKYRGGRGVVKSSSSKSQGSPTQRNKKDSPKKPTKSPAQRDRDNQINEVAKQKLLKELNAPTNAQNYGLGSATNAQNYGLGSATNATNYGLGSATNATNYGLGSATNATNYGLGSATNATNYGLGSATNAQNYGLGSATNAQNYGLGSATNAQNYGLGSATNATNYGLGSATNANNYGLGSATNAQNYGLGSLDTNKVAADSSAVGKSVDPVSTVPNVAGGFTDEVAAAAGPSELVKTIEDLTTFKKGGKDDVKNIMSKVRDMEKAIDGSVQLSNYDKLQYKDQIKYAKANFAKMGYSLNEVMAAVGTNAFNKMVSKTPISRDDAVARGQLDEVQGIMDEYGRPAVLRKDGTIGPMQPTIRQVGGDIKRRLNQDAQNLGGLFQLTPAGMIANFLKGKNQSTANRPGGVRQEPKFGFGDIPSGANQFLKDGYAQYINSPINLSDREFTPFMAPSAPQRALANAMRSGGGGGQQSQTQQGSGSESEESTTASGPLSYQTYAKPVAYNYFGGPEQIYLGGGYQQDGKTIGPFGYANGGIANFKPYGY